MRKKTVVMLGASLFAAPAQAYPIDCAILLCLAGGFPPSVECTAAKAVFIRRITPFPIEPPLQVWNCPMGVSGPAPLTPGTRLYKAIATETSKPRPQIPPLTDDFWGLRSAGVDVSGSFVFPVQSYPAGDISDPVFDFVRSIKVWRFDYRQHEENGTNCVREDASRIGGYDLQGDFHWVPHALHQLAGSSGSFWNAPIEASIQDKDAGSCKEFRYRAVTVSWKDYFGKRGFHEVRY